VRRLVSHITTNWRGRTLTGHVVLVNTIAAICTGLCVEAELDASAYPLGRSAPTRNGGHHTDLHALADPRLNGMSRGRPRRPAARCASRS
jgi:hypothetical protein